MLTHSQEIEKINSSMLRMLKNINTENQMLEREIQRMQRIDRIKVANAKTSVFMPEFGSVFPSLDMFSANAANQSVSIPNEQPDKDLMSSPSATHRNVVTANEINGVCDRLGGGGIYTG